MGKFYPELPDNLFPWVAKQHCFWVATAPLAGAGHVNVSPKGTQDGKIFHVVDNKSVYYFDLTGSGNETVSHLYEPGNGRLTILFNAFEGPPQILRLWGHGRVFEKGSAEFQKIVPPGSLAEEDLVTGTRAIIWLDIDQVGTSCGYSVPNYEFRSFRRVLENFSNKKDQKEREGNYEEGWDMYWAYKNAKSMDGLPGMRRGVETGKKHQVRPIEKMVGVAECYPLVQRRQMRDMAIMLALGMVLGMVLMLAVQKRHAVMAQVQRFPSVSMLQNEEPGLLRKNVGRIMRR